MKKRVLVAPFVVLPLALRLLVGPIGDSFAAGLARMAPPAPSAGGESEAPVDDEPAPPSERHGERGRSARHGGGGAPRRGAGDEHGGDHAGAEHGGPVTTAGDAGVARGHGDRDASAPRSVIVVPSSVVGSAIADKRIGARDAVDDENRPIGARIHGVGRYKTGLQNGDIIVSVGGTPTPTTAALVEVAMRIVGAGATRLTGKIRRGDALVDVVLELPPRER